MTWCSLWTPMRSVSPSSRCGRLAWKVKGSVSTWRRPCSWSLVMAMMSSRNLASTPVLSAVVVSPTTPSNAHSVCCGSTRIPVASLSNWLSTQTMSPPGVRLSWPIDGRTVTEVDVDSTKLDEKAIFCYLGDTLCSGGGCGNAIASRCCVAWGNSCLS